MGGNATVNARMRSLVSAVKQLLLWTRVRMRKYENFTQESYQIQAHVSQKKKTKKTSDIINTWHHIKL